MVRLGAKRTVKGYLAEVAANRLMQGQDDSPVNDLVSANWDKLVGDLPPKWKPESFVKSLIKFHAAHGWSFAHGTKRGTFGREDRLVFCTPSVVDIVHTDMTRLDAPSWSEPGLWVQGWDVLARQGKAKIRIAPSGLIFTTHALERIYERAGGASYAEFPALVGRVTDAMLHKLAPLMMNDAFVRGDRLSGVAAVPVESGLAIIELNASTIGGGLPQLGSEIWVRGGHVTQRPGLQRITGIASFPDQNIIVSTLYVMRTFYGMDELNEQRSESMYLINMLLERLEPSPLSLYSLMNIEEPENLLSAPHKVVDPESSPFRGLVADVRDSLHWLKPQRDDYLYIYEAGSGEKAAKAATSHRKSALDDMIS